MKANYYNHKNMCLKKLSKALIIAQEGDMRNHPIVVADLKKGRYKGKRFSRKESLKCSFHLTFQIKKVSIFCLIEITQE